MFLAGVNRTYIYLSMYGRIAVDRMYAKYVVVSGHRASSIENGTGEAARREKETKLLITI